MKKLWRELRLTAASEIFRWSFALLSRVPPKDSRDLTIYMEGFYLMSKTLASGTDHIPPTAWVKTERS